MSKLLKEGQIKILCDKRECQSVVYIVTTEPNTTVLKGQDIWYEGQRPFRRIGEDEDAKEKVRKEEMIRKEAEIFGILGRHARIITFYGLELLPDNTAWAIRLELAKYGSLRNTIVAAKPEPIEWRVRIAREVAEGVAYLHSHDVIWGDSSTRNILLCDSGGHTVAKLCDFASSDLESEYPQCWYGCETRYCPPGPQPHWHQTQTRLQELFALGSITCEITQWTVPYGADTESDAIESAVARGILPFLDRENNPAAGLIRKCWAFEYDSTALFAAELSSI